MRQIITGLAAAAIICVSLSRSPAVARINPETRVLQSGEMVRTTCRPVKQIAYAESGCQRSSFTGRTPGRMLVPIPAARKADAKAGVVREDTLAPCAPGPTAFCPGDSLQAKVDAAEPGTKFTFAPGVYRLQSIKPKDGQAFIGQAGVVLSGARRLSGWQSDGAGYWYIGGQTQQNTRYNTNYNCETGHDGCFYPEQLWVNDTLYEHMTTLAAVTAGSQKWFFDYAASRIYLARTPAGQEIETSVATYAFGGTAEMVVVKHLDVTRFANDAQRGAINYSPGRAWTIDSNVVHDSHGVGIKIGRDGVMRGNEVYGMGQLGIAAGGRNGLIEGNYVHHNNTAFFGRGNAVELGGSKFAMTTNLVVRDNVVTHNRGPGLWTDVNNVGTLYERNRVDSNDWKGIFDEVSYGTVIRNNTVRGNGFHYDGQRSACDGAGIQIANSPDVEIYGNLVADNRAGICAQETERTTPTVPSGKGPHDVLRLNVHHNLVVQIDNGRAGGITDTDPAADPYAKSADNRWTHNTYQLGATTTFCWAHKCDYRWVSWQSVGQDSGSTQAGQ